MSKRSVASWMSSIMLGSLAVVLPYAAGPAEAMPNANGSQEQGILYNGCETSGFGLLTGCHNGRSRNGYEAQGVPNNGAEMSPYFIDPQGVLLNGLRQRPATGGPAIKAVILPSGESIDLR
jgi:hypothetical protein